MVALLTLLGLVLRCWSPARLGLVHFDEGVYAIAGLWSVSGGGLWGIDPSVIPYAPPGFPALVGLAYALFGASDLAAILVSILAGSLTIPLAGWLAYRSFGAGAGAAAAALVALSGAHLSFSRMALTDAAFLACWVLGLICGQRFVERPGARTALELGLSVGLAQLFKYNGWLLGAIALAAVCLGPVSDPAERRPARLLASWGHGLAAAAVAAAVTLPWFRFVEAHGGYARLLEHQRGYLGGFQSWLPHLRVQLAEATALAGGLTWTLPGVLAALGCRHLTARPGPPRPPLRDVLGTAALVVSAVLLPSLIWLAAAFWIIDPRERANPRRRLLAAAWLVLAVLTPFYHPYARLWLPLHLLACLALVHGLAAFQPARSGPDPLQAMPAAEPAKSRNYAYVWICGLAAVSAAVFLAPAAAAWPGRRGGLPGILAPTDSLRIAVRTALRDLPRSVPGLRVLARPAVVFYGGGRVPIQREADWRALAATATATTAAGDGRWALVDLVQLRGEADPAAARAALLSGWELVQEYSTRLNLATLLDVDPGTAGAGRPDVSDAPLWLLRPRMAGTP